MIYYVEVLPRPEQIRYPIDRMSETGSQRRTEKQNLPICMKILKSKHVLHALCLTYSSSTELWHYGTKVIHIDPDDKSSKIDCIYQQACVAQHHCGSCNDSCLFLSSSALEQHQQGRQLYR